MFGYGQKRYSMEVPFFIATPDKSYTTFLILLFILAGLLLFLYLVHTRKIQKVEGAFRQVSLLLSSLISLILFTTSLFTAWNLYTLQPVKLYDTYLESYYGKTPYKAIRRAGIYKDEGKSFINPQLVTRKDDILVIETKDRKTWLFADDNYEVSELIKRIRAKMEE